MHRYASKYGTNSEECPQSDVHSRLFQLKEMLKKSVFSRKDTYNKVFILLQVPPLVHDKNAEAGD